MIEDVPPAGAGLSRALLYGDGLFETVRVLNSQPLFLQAHRERFLKSARELGYPAASVQAGLEGLESLRGVARDGLWRITVVRPAEGVPGAGFGGVFRAWREAPPQAKALRLTTLWGYYFPGNWLAEHKTTSWLRSVEALRRARAAGFDEALLLSPQGEVGEAAAANIFAFVDGAWVTPPIDGVLPGVVRRVVLEEARRSGEEISERPLMIAELERAEAMALTSTGRLVTAVTSLEGRALASEPVKRLVELLAGRFS